MDQRRWLQHQSAHGAEVRVEEASAGTAWDTWCKLVHMGACWCCAPWMWKVEPYIPSEYQRGHTVQGMAQCACQLCAVSMLSAKIERRMGTAQHTHGNDGVELRLVECMIQVACRVQSYRECVTYGIAPTASPPIHHTCITLCITLCTTPCITHA